MIGISGEVATPRTTEISMSQLGFLVEFVPERLAVALFQI